MIRTKDNSPENRNQAVTAALNIACVIENGGYIPTDLERANTKQYGRYWWFDDERPTTIQGKRAHLCSAGNNAFARVEYLNKDGWYYAEIAFAHKYNQKFASACEAAICAAVRGTEII